MITRAEVVDGSRISVGGTIEITEIIMAAPIIEMAITTETIMVAAPIIEMAITITGIITAVLRKGIK